MKVVITGAAGLIGGMVTSVLRQRHDLLLIDRKPDESGSTLVADLSEWNERWIDALAGADVIIHLAANSLAQAQWPDLLKPNIDATINIYEAAGRRSRGEGQ